MKIISLKPIIIKTVLILLCNSCLLKIVNAQTTYSPNFPTLSFYNANSGKDDLHYDYGWQRSSSNVFLDGSNMKILPNSSDRTLWFHTVALQLSGTDMITFNHLLSNIGGGGTKTLTISVIDTATLAETVVNTITYNNSSQQTTTSEVVVLNYSGIFRIKFLFTHTGNLASNPVFQVNSFVTNSTPVFLPVELAEYKASVDFKEVRLDWSTISETNSSHFEIFRSTDGEIFSQLAVMQAQGTSHHLIHYDFADINLPGNNPKLYYRLNQVDLNGNTHELGIIKVELSTLKQDKQLKVLFTDNYSLILKRTNSDKIRNEIPVEIKDMTGKLIQSTKILSGEYSKTIFLNQFSTGIYLIGNSLIGFEKITIIN